MFYILQFSGTIQSLLLLIYLIPTMNEEQQARHFVSINPDRCQGHSRCCMLAPELFDSDDLGYGIVRGEGIVPKELIDKAKLAVANCPEFAIILKRG